MPTIPANFTGAKIVTLQLPTKILFTHPAAFLHSQHLPKLILSQRKGGLIYESIFNLAPLSTKGTKPLSHYFSNQIGTLRDNGFIQFLEWDQNQNTL